MELELFACLAVHDRDAAVDWYHRLLGSEPSMFPNDVEAVWELAEGRHVYVEQAPERAGHSAVTLFVDDLDAWVDGISARGIEPAERETYDNGVRKMLYRDPDGNKFGLGGGPA
jgi:catechol 2,3-dioxygenase-like lactoylglutathione lyase family enzyme